MVQKLTLFFLLLCCQATIFGQLTLSTCFKKARENYPLIKQFDLIETSKAYNIAAANKNWLPQLSISGKASWQSDITSFPDAYLDMLAKTGITGVVFPRKDQYNVGIYLSQTIWDGGTIATQKKMSEANYKVNKEQTEVNLYSLYSQINQLFFNILSLNEQLKQNQLLIEELERNLLIIASYVKNGTAMRTDLDNVKVNILDAKQRKTEMQAYQKAGITILGIFIGENISNPDSLIKPELTEIHSTIGNRPELNLFTAQQMQYEIQSNMLYTKGMPRISLFANGIVGDPGLNLFKAGFTPYFMGGINLSWNFGGLYTLRDEKKNLLNSQKSVSIQKDVFLFNTNQKITQQHAEIAKLKVLLNQDDEIIALRHQIKNTSAAKVENGTMTVSDFLKDVTNENIARQVKALHELNLFETISQLDIETGLIK